MLELNELGNRICIMGPSNSGKSTLADAIARQNEVQAIHLDVLHHFPGTNWVPRPLADFQNLHNAAIKAERWVLMGITRNSYHGAYRVLPASSFSTFPHL